MAELSDDKIAAWADGFIRQNAYNRTVAVQIATEAAKWVRDQCVQVGWYYENLSSGRKGFLPMRSTMAEREEFARAEYAVYPVFASRNAGVDVDRGGKHG